MALAFTALLLLVQLDRMDNDQEQGRMSFWDEVKPYRCVMVVTGAGVSASAGLPLYRLPGSTAWTDAALEEKSHVSRYGNHLPELWRRWWSIIEAARLARPSPAHLSLALWQRALKARGGELLLVTQNVDGLHQRAGASAVEFHGNALNSRCLRCRCTFVTPECPDDLSPPACPSCSGRKTRPGVVLFGERPLRAHRDQVSAMLPRCDLLVMVGTSGHVWPVAGWLQEAQGATTMLVNTESWDHGSFDKEWIATSDEVLKTP